MNAVHASDWFSLSQNVTFHMLSAGSEPGRAEIKKTFHFSQCDQAYPLVSMEGHPLIQPTKLRKKIPMIITDICMGQNPLAWH